MNRRDLFKAALGAAAAPLVPASASAKGYHASLLAQCFKMAPSEQIINLNGRTLADCEARYGPVTEFTGYPHIPCQQDPNRYYGA